MVSFFSIFRDTSQNPPISESDQKSALAIPAAMDLSGDSQPQVSSEVQVRTSIEKIAKEILISIVVKVANRHLVPKDLFESMMAMQSKHEYERTGNMLDTLLKEKVDSGCLQPEQLCWKNVENLVDNLNIKSISHALNNNLHIFENSFAYKRDLTFPYRFWVLLKMFLKSDDFPLIQLSECTVEKVTEEFVTWFSKLDFNFNTSIRLIQILLSIKNYLPILLKQHVNHFVLFSFRAIEIIPFAQWKDKGYAITALCETLTQVAKKDLTTALLKSSDEKTKKIGEFFFNSKNQI